MAKKISGSGFNSAHVFSKDSSCQRYKQEIKTNKAVNFRTL
jgi:hypothetical protein